MDFLNRIFGRQAEGEAEVATGCHICGGEADYHCDSCGEFVCTRHTVVGTATCEICHQRTRAYVDTR